MLLLISSIYYYAGNNRVFPTSNKNIVMDNKKGTSMIVRRNSVNVTLQPYNSPPKTAVSVCPSPIILENTCRICLEQSQLTELCDCRGSSMVHVQCLKLYIAKGQGSLKSKSKCEICGSAFNLVFQKSCRFSCESGLNYIKRSVVSSVLFLIFSLLTIIYISYCSYINGRGELDENLQLVLLIIGACLIVVLLIILIRWIYLYLFISVTTLKNIEPSIKTTTEITLGSLNQSQQHLK